MDDNKECLLANSAIKPSSFRKGYSVVFIIGSLYTLGLKEESSANFWSQIFIYCYYKIMLL